MNEAKGLTDKQREAIRVCLHGFAENFMEEDGCSFEEGLVKARETLSEAVREDGLAGAVKGAYLPDEDDDGNPCGLEGADVEAVLATIATV